MATLKVGDIEINDGKVRIGRPGAQLPGLSSLTSPSVIYHQQQGTGPAPLPQPNYAALNAIPLAPGFIVIAGCILAALGIIGTLVGSRIVSPFDLLSHGTFLIPIGLGLVGVGILKAVHHDSIGLIDVEHADEVTEECIGELGGLLRDEDPRHTIEWMQQKLGWAHGDVVRTLAWLRERGELREELDVDTTHYYYIASPRPRDLDARLRATKSMGH